MRKELPKRANKFYKEYEKLCKKYKLMVLSDGEQIHIAEFDKGLWGLKKSTIDRYNIHEAYNKDAWKELE